MVWKREYYVMIYFNICVLAFQTLALAFCFIEQATLPPMPRTDWFQEHIRAAECIVPQNEL